LAQRRRIERGGGVARGDGDARDVDRFRTRQLVDNRFDRRRSSHR
jgi:hypothetical protein